MTTTDSFTNRWLDRFFRAQARRGMARQLSYPSDATALIMVDCQHDFLKPDQAAPFAQASPVTLRQMGRLADLATTAGWPIILTSVLSPTPGYPTPFQRLIDQHNLCQPGTIGATTISEVNGTDNDHVHEVTHTGLSSFAGSDLATLLDSLGIERVLVAGAFTEIGVDSTARDATELGLHTTVISDASIGLDHATHETQMAISLTRAVHTVTTVDQAHHLVAP